MGHRETDRESAKGLPPGSIYQDPEDGDWVLVTADEDEAYSCGADCCGMAKCRLVICGSLAEAQLEKAGLKL